MTMVAYSLRFALERGQRLDSTDDSMVQRVHTAAQISQAMFHQELHGQMQTIGILTGLLNCVKAHSSRSRRSYILMKRD